MVNQKYPKMSTKEVSMKNKDMVNKCCEAVRWNPYNQVIQCHKCGRTIGPIVNERWIHSLIGIVEDERGATIFSPESLEETTHRIKSRLIEIGIQMRKESADEQGEEKE